MISEKPKCKFATNSFPLFTLNSCRQIMDEAVTASHTNLEPILDLQKQTNSRMLRDTAHYLGSRVSILFRPNSMLLLTNCEVHMGKHLDRSFEVRIERSEVHAKS